MHRTIGAFLEPQTAARQQVVIGVLVVAVTGVLIISHGELGMGLLYLVVFTVIAGLLAYRFPVAMVTLWAVVAPYSRYMIDQVSVSGGVDARPIDPLLLGMAVAISFALLTGDERARAAFFGKRIMWTILMGWLVFQLLRSIPSHGLVSTLGEFRTTFHSILVLPYIVLFVRSPDQQRKLFKSLLLLSLVFIAVALARGGLFHDFAVSSSTRWMVAQVNLALIFSVAGWYVARRTTVWLAMGNTYRVVLFATLLLVIVCSHRSVWLAGSGIILCLTAFGMITPRKFLALSGGLILAGVAIDHFTVDLDLLEFIRVRMLAFTAYEDDPTAAWRFQVWTAAVEQIRANPLFGKGLGDYFQIPLPDGRTVTAPPHNLYVQIALQLGLIGLALYAGFVCSMLYYLWRAFRSANEPLEFAITLYAIVVLVGGSIFYVAYNLETSTWVFVGLGLATALTQELRRRAYVDEPKYVTQE